MNELIRLSFPLESEGMTTVRLATGGVCSRVGLDLDRSEDCKVCVTESLLLLLHAGYCRAEIAFFEDEGLSARITGFERGAEKRCAEDEISLALLGALAGDIHMEKEEGTLTGFSFRFGK